MSSIISADENSEDFDNDIDLDDRDRRAIDEEDDDYMKQELDMLEREVNEEHRKNLERYERGELLNLIVRYRRIGRAFYHEICTNDTCISETTTQELRTLMTTN